jgi:hypothetical protein
VLFLRSADAELSAAASRSPDMSST